VIQDTDQEDSADAIALIGVTGQVEALDRKLS